MVGDQGLTGADAESRRSGARARSTARGSVLVAATAIAIVAFAMAVRYAALATQPGGLYPDEGAEALDAYKLLHLSGFHPVFFHDDGGREALYAYLVAAAFRVAGESTTVLRAVSAAIGVAAIAALYPALRRFSRGVALAGMAWAAGALWLICVSRDGMRNILVPLFGTLLVWALIRWADRPGRGTAFVAGGIAGAGLWTYQPLKLTPLLVALWLTWIAFHDRRWYRALLRDLGWFVLAYILVAAPMLTTAVFDPVNYFGRAAGVSPLNPANHGIDFVTHAWQTLGMFTFTGDPNPRHDVAALPLLGWPLFALACAGARRAWRRRADPGHALLLIGLPVFMLPPLLGLDGGAPHFLRSVGLAPVLAGLIGLGCLEIVEAGRRWFSHDWAAAAVGPLALLLIGLGAASTAAYFDRPVAARYDAYSYDVVAMAEAARPGDAVIIDDYNRIDVDFLDAGQTVEVVAPGSLIGNPGRFTRVLALKQDDIAMALGGAAAARAQVVSRAPGGRPAVWSVNP